MYVYDRANALAQDIKESSEFKEYKALKEEVGRRHKQRPDPAV